MNKDEYIKRFIPLVFKYAPKYEHFSVYDLHKNIPLNETELFAFKKFNFDIKLFLINNGYAELKGSSNIQFLEKGINYFDDFNIKELENKILNLTETNLNLQNTHFRRYILYSLISFIAGAILTNVKDILILLNIANPK